MVTKWLNSGYIIDSDEKLQIILNLFSETRIACIYGSAGTGKTTILNHLFHFLSGSTKICLAVTNPARDNLERKIDDRNSRFYTISTFLGLPTELRKCNLLVIDECSTVSNEDFQSILYNSEFGCAVFVGDTYQIESINFGNWFEVLPYFIPRHCVNTLTVPYRSAEDNLLKLWERARINEGDLLEYLTKYGFSKKVDESLFESFDNDQIILCLNYNGPFGINNVNKIFQSKNPHALIKWELEEYKKGDPILFNTSSFLRPYIYNNLKGKIAAIEKQDSSITFDVELNTVITDVSLCRYLKIVSQNEGKTTVRFTVNKHKNPDSDIDQPLTVVPFNVAYAVSIHKSQGLEYDSVKIIISDDVEESITHNIFYTAITRARKNLDIFWSTSTEEYVLSHMKRHDPMRDVRLLRAIYPDLLLDITNKCN